MFLTRSENDRGVNSFSHEGRLFQVEYAIEAIKGEAKLLDSIVGRVVPLLPVSPTRAESELEASVEKLFDEGGSTKHVDSAAEGGHDAEIEFVTAAKDTATSSVATKRPKRPRKKRSAATDASGSSHPPKKLRGDYETSSEVVVGGKSSSALKELLASNILSAEAGVSAMPTLPFINSSVFATPRHTDGTPLDSIIGANLRIVGPAVRSIVPSPVTTKAVITTSVAHVSLVSIPRVTDKVIPQVQQSIFQESTSTYTIKPDANVPNDALLDDLDISREFIDHLAPPVRMRTEYCLSEIKRLESECGRQADLLKSREEEVENLKSQLLLKEVEAARLLTQDPTIVLGSRAKGSPFEPSLLHQLDMFYNALNPNDQDALDSAAGGNFLDKIPRDGLAIIESKSKVRYSRSRVTDLRVSTNAPLSSSSPSNSFKFQQIAASLEDKLDIRMSRFEKTLNNIKALVVTPPTPIKVVEEICVTYGENHSYHHCPLTRGGNEFPIFMTIFSSFKRPQLETSFKETVIQIWQVK
nr:proteasome subunit alpha type-5-like [Tanacetum cinerariifolium]